MDELITKHGQIMDQYDPEKRVGLIVDEWGTWFDVEPGTNPGFLYQQNSIRDALVAAIHFNIFHKHNDRVHMANIAQMVNVLQAMILTEGDQFILTPTYHVFEMYRVHQDAERVELAAITRDYIAKEESIPSVNATASRDADGVLHISLCQLDHQNSDKVEIDLRGIGTISDVSARILTADHLNAHNTFEQPDLVAPREHEVQVTEDGKLIMDVPAMSVITLAVR